MEWSVWLTAVVAVLVAVHLYYAHRFSYWRKRGVPHPKTLPVLGNFEPLRLGRKNLIHGLLHQAMPFREHGYCGLYQFGQPILIVWDPEMVKQILCKDFGSFHDRGIPADDRDPLTQHLFNLAGPKWRNLRNRLSPTFTSGKLKLMLPLMREISEELNAILGATQRATTGEVHIDKLLFRYATDIIGSVAFGIRCNCMRDENNQFLAMSLQVFQQTPAQLVRMVLEAIHPKLGRLLPFRWIIGEVHNFFLGLVSDTVKHREDSKVERNDFVQLLMQVRDQDLAQADPDNHIALTPGVMAAQSFIFFIAGLDSIANTVSFCLSRLAADSPLQDRVASEVRDVLRQHDGHLSYEALKKMALVDRTVMEALRLWSPAGLILRQCNATTQLGSVLVDKGVHVIIMTDMMHSDRNVFPEPKRFDPERHTAQARSERHPYAFLPFGEGPRICIAERFALLEMKLALATLLRHFAFAVGPSYEDDVQLDPKAFFPRPKNGFKLRVAARD